MKASELHRLDGPLSEFTDWLVEGLGPQRRLRSLRLYVTGLLLDGERKSIGPDGESLGWRSHRSERQCDSGCSRRHAWRNGRKRCSTVGSTTHGSQASRCGGAGYRRHGGSQEKGNRYVGVSRQYLGTLGRTDNCQVAVSLHLASERGSACLGKRLFFLQQQLSDTAQKRRRQAVHRKIGNCQVKFKLLLK
jgi:SRSO17 transposase